MVNTKTFTIFAGVNGAGKSTLYAADNSSDLGVRLNSDELVREAGLDWRSTEAQLKAGKQLLKMQKECFEKGISCNRETTLCGSNIVNSIRTAKELGYKIRLRYVGVSDPQIAKERVKRRIELGGHGVSESTIEHRYETSAENFLKVYNLCDQINIYDNSGEYLILAAYSIHGKLQKTDANVKWVNDLLDQIQSRNCG